MHKLQTLLRRFARSSRASPTAFPPGHFYSPVADVAELRAQLERIWPAHPSVLGIDFNDAYHQRVLREYFPAFYPEFAYPAKPHGNPLGFYVENDQFRLELGRDVDRFLAVARNLYPATYRLEQTAHHFDDITVVVRNQNSYGFGL